jgi:hypothetical protein
LIVIGVQEILKENPIYSRMIEELLNK